MDILGFDCQKKCESELDGLTETDEIEVVDDDNEETVDVRDLDEAASLS